LNDYHDTRVTLYQGHALEVLKNLPADSVDCVMTSPPYWSQRKYHTSPLIWDGDLDCRHQWQTITRTPSSGPLTSACLDRSQGAVPSHAKSATLLKQQSGYCKKCGAWRGDLGLEPTVGLYIAHLITIFDEVKRVLKPAGTCFVNISDSYAGSGGTGSQFRQLSRLVRVRPPAVDIPIKSLCRIPERFVIAMSDHGWIGRNNICWYKRNCMPESVKDRFTDDWEPLYFFTKSTRYFFEQQFEPLQDCSIERVQYGWHGQENDDTYRDQPDPTEEMGERWAPITGRNKRTVWDIPAAPSIGSHYAAYPDKLCEPPILAGCPAQICVECGRPRQKIIVASVGTIGKSMHDHGADAEKGMSQLKSRAMYDGTYHRDLNGFTDCGCGAPFEPGTVLDPFAGTGTTGAVAKALGRKAVLVELSPRYCALIKKRLELIKVPMNL
jgi:site-specific DNA-methyltransferase (adenine-specific)